VSHASTYAYTDANAAALGVSTLYYRLRQVDTEGTASMSPVRSVRLARGGIVLYPNPTTEQATLDLSSLTAGTYSVQIVDVTGRLLQQLTLQPGQPALDVRALAAGTYFVKVQGNGVNTVLPLQRR
jgi:hypothetical protein